MITEADIKRLLDQTYEPTEGEGPAGTKPDWLKEEVTEDGDR